MSEAGRGSAEPEGNIEVLPEVGPSSAVKCEDDKNSESVANTSSDFKIICRFISDYELVELATTK